MIPDSSSSLKFSNHATVAMLPVLKYIKGLCAQQFYKYCSLRFHKYCAVFTKTQQILTENKLHDLLLV